MPKVKDLVNSPVEEYKEIENTLKTSSSTIKTLIEDNNNNTDDSINQNEMKKELNNFFSELNMNQSYNRSERSFVPY